MDLLDRYLGFIRWQLPAATRDDIVDELRDVLMSRFEEKAEALGRPLKASEQEEVLTAFGHPLMVAQRYRPRQHLIGPRILPLYVLAVQAAAAIILGINGVKLGLALAGGENVGLAIVAFMRDSVQDGIYTLGVLTLAAAALDLMKVRLRFLERWRVRDLPVVRMRRSASPWELLLEATLQVGFLLIWTGVWPISTTWSRVIDGQLMQVAPAPVWAEYHPIIAVILAVQILPPALRLLRPAWVRIAAAVEMAGYAATALVAALLVREGAPWAIVTFDGAPADAGLRIDLGLEIGLWSVMGVSIALAGGALWKLARAWPR